MTVPKKTFGGLADVDRYEKMFKTATAPYTTALAEVQRNKGELIYYLLKPSRSI